MRKLILSAAAIIAIASVSPAFAEGPRASGGSYPAQVQGEAQAPLHYAWQYGYIGHHPRYAGHWVLTH